MEKKMDKIRHRAVIHYLVLKGLTPKEVHQDIQATLGEDTPLYSMVNMVKKWAANSSVVGRAWKTTPVQEDCTMPDFVHFSIFKV